MKKLHLIMLVVSAMFLTSTSDTIAQNFCKTDPAFNKVLVDNEIITAMEVTFEPGKTTNIHTHPASYIYALTDGTLFVKFADGETETVELKTGDSAYLEPERPHMTVNTGKKPVKILLVELKEKPYMSDSKMK